MCVAIDRDTDGVFKHLPPREYVLHIAGFDNTSDSRDSGRDAAPLKQAEDADLLDTSDMDIEEAIAAAIRLVEGKLNTD